MKQLFLFVACFICLASCSDRPDFNFKNSEDAIIACRKELSALKKIKTADSENFTKLCQRWIDLHDSTLICFNKDTTIHIDSQIANDYYSLTDSIKTELERIAFNKKYSIAEVVKIKLSVGHGRTKEEQKAYQIMCKKFKEWDQTKVLTSPEMTLRQYYSLMQDSISLVNEKDLLELLEKEDLCFRSLMAYLPQISNQDLDSLTLLTNDYFNYLAKKMEAAGEKETPVSSRAIIYLRMRVNRRLAQNAEVCRNNIEKKLHLSIEDTSLYRWMLVQPFLILDCYSVPFITPENKSFYISLAESLPSLISVLDEEKNSPGDIQTILSDFFMKSFLSSLL